MKKTQWTDSIDKMSIMRTQANHALTLGQISAGQLEADGDVVKAINIRVKMSELSESLVGLNDELASLMLLHEADILTGNYTEPFIKPS